MSAVSVTVPYPPSANSLYANRATGAGRFRTPAYTRWKTDAAWSIRQERGRNKVSGPYALNVQVGRPDNRKRDLCNLLKALEDALVMGGAVDDDSLCQEAHIKWSPHVTGAHVLVLSAGARE